MQKEVTTTIIVDDFDGETPAETRAFSIGGTSYEADLSEDTWAYVQNVVETVDKIINVARPIQPPAQDDDDSKVDEVAEKRTRKAAATKKAPAKKRPVGRKTTRSRKPASEPTPAAIREWAHENNVPVSSTGRVGKSTREAYAKAHAA